LPIAITRVWATGTVATGVLGLKSMSPVN
jgi:hypothetical protein